jgi:hypothetical protein
LWVYNCIIAAKEGTSAQEFYLFFRTAEKSIIEKDNIAITFLPGEFMQDILVYNQQAIMPDPYPFIITDIMEIIFTPVPENMIKNSPVVVVKGFLRMYLPV